MDDTKALKTETESNDPVTSGPVTSGPGAAHPAGAMEDVDPNFVNGAIFGAGVITTIAGAAAGGIYAPIFGGGLGGFAGSLAGHKAESVNPTDKDKIEAITGSDKT